MSYNMKEESYSVEYEEVEKATQQAWLIRFDDGRGLWFPKSLCTVSHTSGPGALTAPAWLLEEKGISYEV